MNGNSPTQNPTHRVGVLLDLRQTARGLNHGQQWSAIRTENSWRWGTV